MKRFGVLLIWSALFISMLAACNAKTTLRYRVTGTAEKVSIQLVNEFGETSSEIVTRPPFDISFEIGREFDFQIYVTNLSDTGEIKCEVLLNGELLGEANGSNFSGCEGTYIKLGSDVQTHFTAYDDVFPKGLEPETQPLATEPSSTDLGGATIMALGNSENGMALYLFDTSSGEIVQWTEPLGFIGCGDWSPIESKIAFNAGSPGNVHIYVMPLDGISPVRLDDMSRSLGSGNDGCPDWSSDGKEIAFDAGVPVGHHILYMNTAGTIFRSALTRGENFVNTHADWSPDGSKIVFASLLNTVSSVQVVNLDGTDPVTLIESGSDSYASPVWSPNGEQIAFIRDVKGPEASIYVMDADGGNVKPVTNQPAYHIDSLAWSPDGTRLIFNATEETVGFRGIYMINVDGRDQTYLTSLPDVDLSGLRFVPEGLVTDLPTQPVPLP